jgi:replicative DNA helicase
MKAVNQIYESPIYIYPGSHMNPQKFTALAHRAKEEFNIEVIVVDYFQLMDGDDLRKNREQQLSDVGRSMKTVAKELGIPIILIAQLNDNGKLRETRSLQMHADTLTKIMASKADKERHILSIDYNREGETAKIACRFLKEFGRFEQIEDGETNEDDFEE